MESIREILARYQSGTVTPDQNRSTGTPLEPVPMTDEQTEAVRQEQLRRSLGVSSLLHTFERFERVPGTVAAYQAFQALAEGETDRTLLMCYGGVGNGKTHLCEALVIRLSERGLWCRYNSFAQVMRTLKAGMSKQQTVDYDTLLQRLCTNERLVLDDVGAGGSGSQWESGVLEEIVNARYHERLFTVLTTNRTPRELPERVVSRFSDRAVAALVLNEGEDYRRRQ